MSPKKLNTINLKQFGIDENCLSFRTMKVLHLNIKHLLKIRGSKDIAGELNIGSSRFRHQFLAECKIPFKEFLIWVRLYRAQFLMGSEELLKEIADESGFKEYSDFSRTFKQKLGMNPSGYRRNLARQDFFKIFHEWRENWKRRNRR